MKENKYYNLIPFIFQLLLYIATTIVMITGIFHTYKHHGKIAFAASMIPPVGIYRGIESYFHKEEKNEIDWNKRIMGDTHILYMLLAATPKKEDMSTFNEGLEKFSKKISTYPDEKVIFLKEAGKKYARFLIAFSEDLNGFMHNRNNKPDSINSQDWSKKSKPILDSIIKEYDIKELTSAYNEMDSTIKLISKSGNSFRELQIDPELFFNNLKKLLASDIYRISRTYKMIFNEEIGISISENNSNENL